MRWVFPVAAVREAEAWLMRQLPDDALMQRAAYGLQVVVVDQLRRFRGKASGATVLGLVGPGSNGSDSLLALSLLARRGVKVIAVDVTGKRKSVAADHAFLAAGGQFWSLRTASSRAASIDCVLDGIAGLGSSRPVPADVMSFLAATSALIIAVDVPTGVDVDAAAAIDPNAVVRADVTVTFGCLKPCHVIDPAADLCGELHLVDIGLDSFAQQPAIRMVSDEDAAEWLAVPQRTSNKYNRGVVAVVAGSDRYPGARLLSVAAARWGGSGLVQQIGGEFDPLLPSVVRSETTDQADCIVIGPGLVDDTEAALKRAIKSDASLVIDAAGLNALCASSKLRGLLHKRKALAVLTPHGGEAVRLATAYGVHLTDRPHIDAPALALATNAVVYLKGSVGVIATPKGRIVVTHRTVAHLSTAGSGDVLAGLLGSMLAFHRPKSRRVLAELVAAAVIIHSRAAELLVLDGEPVIAEDLEAEIPSAIAELSTLRG